MFTFSNRENRFIPNYVFPGFENVGLNIITYVKFYLYDQRCHSPSSFPGSVPVQHRISTDNILVLKMFLLS